MRAELLKYHQRGEIKFPLWKDDDIEIRLSLMGVSVIADSGPEMTELDDLREKVEGKINKIKMILIIAIRRYIMPTSVLHRHLHF